MINYTGHPFIDIGSAAMAAYHNKRPGDLTTDDLAQVAEYIEQNYIRAPLRGHLTMAFTSNAWFIQDAFNPDKPDLSTEKRAERRATRDRWAAHHLRQWENDETSGEVCIFTGLPAAPRELSGKLAAGRLGRNQMPLLQGDDAINFFTGGDPGLPVSPLALLALQFMPMGCAKCGVGLLAVHSDSEALTMAFARRFFEQNIAAVLQAQAAGEDKLPSAQRSLKTLLIETLTDIEEQRHKTERRSGQAASITAYNFNNGKSPQLALYHLPLQISNFLRIALTATYRDTWQQIVQRGWQREKVKQQSKQKKPAKWVTDSDQETAFKPFKNYVYEDLFLLPGQSTRFLRRHLLYIPHHLRKGVAGVSDNSALTSSGVTPWFFIELFLREVLAMDQIRVDLIRGFADSLADYIEQSQANRFLRNFRVVRDYNQFRTLLINALSKASRQGTLLLDYQQFIDLFENAEDGQSSTWRLVRDLAVIRIIEQLHQRQKLQSFEEALEDDTTTDEEE